MTMTTAVRFLHHFHRFDGVGFFFIRIIFISKRLQMERNKESDEPDLVAISRL